MRVGCSHCHGRTAGTRRGEGRRWWGKWSGDRDAIKNAAQNQRGHGPCHMLSGRVLHGLSKTDCCSAALSLFFPTCPTTYSRPVVSPVQWVEMAVPNGTFICGQIDRTCWPGWHVIVFEVCTHHISTPGVKLACLGLWGV
jgi:hypothetical protein